MSISFLIVIFNVQRKDSHAVLNPNLHQGKHRMLRDIFETLERGCDKFAHYFPLYEQYFGKFVGRAPKILEIGVQHGGSAEMWRKYFGDGTQIVGVDIAPRCEETDYLKLVVGDQGSPDFWKTHFSAAEASFDIIIDDGSHDNPHQIVTLRETYRTLRDGGIYWCEDTHTSYYQKVRVKDGGYLNKRSFTEYAKRIIDVMSSEHCKFAIGVGPFKGAQVPEELIELYDHIRGMHFYDSVIVIEKGERLVFERLVHVASP